MSKHNGTKTATALNFVTVQDRIITYMSALASQRLRFTLQFNPKQKQFIITGCSDADAIKCIVPDADIRLDNRNERYAVITLEYE